MRPNQLLMISLLPATMAEFNNCARPNGEWVGFDQVNAMRDEG